MEDLSLLVFFTPICQINLSEKIYIYVYLKSESIGITSFLRRFKCSDFSVKCVHDPSSSPHMLITTITEIMINESAYSSSHLNNIWNC